MPPKTQFMKKQLVFKSKKTSTPPGTDNSDTMPSDSEHKHMASEVKQLRKQLDDKDDEIESLKVTVDAGTERQNTMQQLLHARDREIDDLKQQIKNSSTGSGQKIKELEDLTTELRSQRDDALYDVKALMGKHEHMQEGLRQAAEREESFNKTCEELQALRQQLEGLQNEHSALNAVHEEAQNALHAHQQQQISIHERIHETENNLALAEEAVRQEQAQREQDQQHYAQAEADLRTQLDQQQHQTEETRAHAQAASEAHAVLAEQVNALTNELNAASQQQERADHVEGVLKSAIVQVQNLKNKLQDSEHASQSLEKQMENRAKEHTVEMETLKKTTLKPVQDARQRAVQAVNSLNKEQMKVTKFKKQFREQEERAKTAEDKIADLLSQLGNQSTMAEETRHRLEAQCYELAQETDVLRTGDHIPLEKIEQEVQKILLKHELEAQKEPMNPDAASGYTVIPQQIVEAEMIGEPDGWTTVIDAASVAVNGGSNSDLMISAEIDMDGIIDQLRVMMYDEYKEVVTNFLARNQKSPLFIKPLTAYLKMLEKNNKVLPIIAPPRNLIDIYHDFESK